MTIRVFAASIALACLAACSAPPPPVAEAPPPKRIARPDRALTAAEAVRFALYDELQAVKLSNCEFERIGDSYDGGYVTCTNLVGRAEAFYSYGISATDNWGCVLSERHRRPVHQYDCYNLTRPVCGSKGATPTFHEECVGPAQTTQDGRPFDSIEHQVQRNGDAGKPIVMKMDVEGSEWESFLATPDAVLTLVDQLSVEFHGIEDPRYVEVIKKLKNLFYVVHVHFNNYTCTADAHPLPATVFEVLFVNKNLGRLDPSGRPAVPNPFEAPNNPGGQDCQTVP